MLGPMSGDEGFVFTLSLGTALFLWSAWVYQALRGISGSIRRILERVDQYGSSLGRVPSCALTFIGRGKGGKFRNSMAMYRAA